MANVKSREAIVASVEKNCRHFGTGQRGLQSDLEATARHIAETGDHTVAIAVIDTVQNDDHAHREATHMVRWLDKYCGIEFTEGEDQDGNTVIISSWKGAKFIRDNFKDGKANPYFKGIKKVNPYRFNLVESLEAVVSQANKAQVKKAKDPTADVNTDGMAETKAFIATLKAS